VYRVTRTRMIDQLGGVARSIPGTAVAFLIGAAAIVGLPPLNGFVGEWVIFRGLFATTGSPGVLRAAAAGAAGLALAGGLALACFTKLYGVIFLGSPRSGFEAAPEAQRGLVLPQGLLAALCVGIGLVPALVVPAASHVAAAIVAVPVDAAPPVGALALVSTLGLVLLALVALLWLLRSTAARAPRFAPTWGCGYPAPTPRMQYTASSYAAALLGFFGPLSGSRREMGAHSVHVHAVDPVLDQLTRPVWHLVSRWALGLRRLQTGRIFWYLLYVILTLLGLLLYLWFFRA